MIVVVELPNLSKKLFIIVRYNHGTDGGRPGCPVFGWFFGRCNFCGNPVGIGDALASGDHAGASAGDHSQRPSRSHSGAIRTRAKPFIGYCHSCRKVIG